MKSLKTASVTFWRTFASGAALLSVLAAVPSARAQVFDSSGANYEPPEPERRFGFTFGVGVGMGYASAVGYPNKLGEIDNPEFERSVSGVGSTNALWLGGTLRDWFTFGLGLSSRGGTEGDLTAGSGAFVVHIEGFPLWALGGEWRDVGLFTELGAGSSVIIDGDQDIVADGGAMSVLGIGAFYEPWQLWHFSVGPSLQYHHEFSQSLTSDVVSLGLRVAFYGVQP